MQMIPLFWQKIGSDEPMSQEKASQKVISRLVKGHLKPRKRSSHTS